MRTTRILQGWCVLICGAAYSPHLRAQCIPFVDSLDSAVTVANSGGFPVGAVSFVPSINGNGVLLAGSGYINYTHLSFDTSSGGVAMWVRKNASDFAGGLFQIGLIGQPNSIGVGYTNDVDLQFEARNSAGNFASVYSAQALSFDDWKHVVAVWRTAGGGLDLWLYIDGRFIGYNRLEGAFTLSAGQMQVGVAGSYGIANVLLDELRFANWSLSNDELYAEYVVSANRQNTAPTVKPQSTGPVQVSGGSILLNGQPFTIKGVGYQPVPVGAPISQSVLDFIYTDPSILARDMALLRDMGVNTIRTWSQPPDLTLLDACYNGGQQPIYLLVGFWVPQDPGINYSDPVTIADIEADFRALIGQFENHPAVLAWGIGNENNLNYQRPLSEWYGLADHLAEVAYQEEGAGYHPCVVINGGLLQLGDSAEGADDVSLPHIDLWGVNAYPGESFHCFFDYYEQLSQKPLVITEYGIDALDNRAGIEYEPIHAWYVVSQWRQLRARCVGGTAMAYSDEWWKAGNPGAHDNGGYETANHPDGFSNEEWWGLLRAVDNGAGPDVLQPREAYLALSAEFHGHLGDMNCDGVVDHADVGPFALALIDEDSYVADHAACSIELADLNDDTKIDGLDIQGFATVLISNSLCVALNRRGVVNERAIR